MSAKKLGKWYKKKHSIINYDKKKIKILFFKNLQKLGYRYFNVQKRSQKDKRVIKSFQRHYLPKNVTGVIDQKTYKISHFLTH